MNWINDCVATADLMRRMDKKAIEVYGIPGVLLMENAGRGAFEFLLREFGPRKVAVFAGKGNNGGDGFVIARHLFNSGVEVHTFVLAKKNEIKGDARVNLEILYQMGAPVLEAAEVSFLEDHHHLVENCDVIVDAILGTGIASEVRGFYRTVIEYINRMCEKHPGIRVLAVDLPSGINADTGQVMGAAVAADATVTFGMLKAGLLSYPGAELAGTLVVVDISLPREFYGDVPYRVITRRLAGLLFPRRGENWHKGAAGHGLVLAGSPGKSGAAVMAAESALRTGAGLVTLAGPASLHPIFETKTLEVMTEPLPETPRATLGEAAAEAAVGLLAGKTAVALGPGLGRGKEIEHFVRTVVEKCARPLVIDADGLFALAADLSVLSRAGAPVILTPHPGEMARLCGRETKEVLADRLNVALEFAKRHQVVLVLKGAHSLIAFPDGRAFFNLTGNPGMASGGTGDVLTGVILGLLCQGLAAEDAAVLGVFLHGLAGDLAVEEVGEEGLIAGDVMNHLPRAVKWILDEETDDA